MTIHEKTAFHRTARWGACAVVGVVALTACGEGTTDVATISASPVAAPAAPYVAPEQQDRAAQLAARAERESAGGFDRRATVSTSGYAAAEAAEQRAAEAQAKFRSASAAEAARYLELQRDGAANGRTSAYVSPEQADREALFEVRAAHASADALERRAVPKQTSAPASADALERRGTSDHTSAHRSADALERWALSEGEN